MIWPAKHLATTNLTLTTGSQLRSKRCGIKSEENLKGDKVCSFSTSSHNKQNVCLLFHFFECAKCSANLIRSVDVSIDSDEMYPRILVTCNNDCISIKAKFYGLDNYEQNMNVATANKNYYCSVITWEFHELNCDFSQFLEIYTNKT